MINYGNRLAEYRGKSYVERLKEILAEDGREIQEAFDAIKKNTRKVTPVDMGIMTIKFRLPLKAIFEHLEDGHRIHTGKYDSLKGRGMKVGKVLRESMKFVKYYTITDFDGNRYKNCILRKGIFYSSCCREIRTEEVSECGLQIGINGPPVVAL